MSNDKIAINSFMYENDSISRIMDMIDGDIINGVGLYSGHISEFEQIEKEKRNKFTMVSYYVHFMDIYCSQLELSQLDIKMQKCYEQSIGNITLVLTNHKQIQNWEVLFLELCTILYFYVDRWKVSISIEILDSKLKKEICFTSMIKAKEISYYMDTNKIKWIVDLYHMRNNSYKIIDKDFYQNVYAVHLSNCEYIQDKRTFLDNGTLPIKSMIDDIKSSGFQSWWEFEILDQKFCSQENLERIYNNIEKYVKG